MKIFYFLHESKIPFRRLNSGNRSLSPDTASQPYMKPCGALAKEAHGFSVKEVYSSLSRLSGSAVSTSLYIFTWLSIYLPSKRCFFLIFNGFIAFYKKKWRYIPSLRLIDTFGPACDSLKKKNQLGRARCWSHIILSNLRYEEGICQPTPMTGLSPQYMCE